MQIVASFTVMVNSPQIGLRQCPIHIADDDLVLQFVKINFRLQCNACRPELDSIVSMAEVKLSQSLRRRMEWLQVAVNVYPKFLSAD